MPVCNKLHVLRQLSSRVWLSLSSPYIYRRAGWTQAGQSIPSLQIAFIPDKMWGMRVGAFEIDDPIPELTEPHALATLRPWVDVGRVGRHTLIRLERHMDAQELGRLARPGDFYDFSRYRPRVMNVGVERRINIPNTTVLYSKREQPPDLLFSTF